jgi:predicted HTH transcriptional regulator
MRPIRIFISSMQKEFAEERATLRDYLRGDPLLQRFYDVFLFEDVPAQDRRADELYLDEVERCDIYLGLFGSKYGHEDAEGVSPTQREFDLASELSKTRFIFVKSSKVKCHPKMAALIAKAGNHIIRRRFTSLPELTAAVYASLVRYLEGAGLLRTGPFDATAPRNATLEDISPDKVQWFLSRARNARDYALAETTTVTDLLTHLDLLDKGKPNHAAILLFGFKPQRFLISSEVKCMHFHTLEKHKPIPSYQIYKGTIFDLVDKAVDFVMSKLNRSVGTRTLGPQAPVEYDIPQEVVAEGIVNAVAHRDYTSNASVEVQLFPDRLEIWNPGTIHPPLTLEKLLLPHASQPNNPLIAEPLFLTKYIEKAGSGTVDMLKRCRKAGLKPPEFRVDSGFFVLTVWRKVVSGAVVQVDHGARSEAQSRARSEARSNQVMRALRQAPLSMNELVNTLGLKSKTGALKRTVGELLAQKLLIYTIPDKPNSRLQKYRLTEKGKRFLKEKE